MFQEPAAAYPLITRQASARAAIPKSFLSTGHLLPLKALENQLHENYLADVACMNLRKGFVHWRIASSMIAPKPAPQAVCMPSPQPPLQIHQKRIWRPIKCRQKALVVVSEAACALAALEGSSRCPSPQVVSAQVLTRVRCTLFWKVIHATLVEGLLDHACLNAGFPQPSAVPATLAARSTSRTCWCQLVRAIGLKSWRPFSKASSWRQPMELSERNASLHCAKAPRLLRCPGQATRSRLPSRSLQRWRSKGSVLAPRLKFQRPRQL